MNFSAKNPALRKAVAVVRHTKRHPYNEIELK